MGSEIKPRLIERKSDKDAKYTKSRKSVVMVIVAPEMIKSNALKLEHWAKQATGLRI